ncbi:MAG: hypothetical protein GY817_08980 [bacterium]|nr:hypothetical protein [bacterium]
MQIIQIVLVFLLLANTFIYGSYNPNYLKSDDITQTNYFYKSDGEQLLKSNVFEDGSGKVGIGTASPLVQTHIYGNAVDTTLAIEKSNGAYLELISDDTIAGIVYEKGNEFRIVDSGGALGGGYPGGGIFTIDANGDFSFGSIMQSPHARVTISDNLKGSIVHTSFYGASSTNDSGITMGSSGGYHGGLLLDGSSTGKMRFVLGDVSSLVNRQSNTKMVIDQSGNVGIGTSNPSGNFEIHNDYGWNPVKVYFSVNDENGYFVSGQELARIDFRGDDDQVMGVFARIMAHSDIGSASGSSPSYPGRLSFWTNPVNSSTPVERMRIGHSGTVSVWGALSKGSGSFDIKHPDPKKADDGMRLRHYFVETPSAGGNIYKYSLDMQEGENSVPLPDYFKHLNKDSVVFVSPLRHFGAGYGEVIDNDLVVTVNKAGVYNILIFADRKDELAMKDFNKYGVEYKAEGYLAV